MDYQFKNSKTLPFVRSVFGWSKFPARYGDYVSISSGNRDKGLKIQIRLPPIGLGMHNARRIMGEKLNKRINAFCQDHEMLDYF